MGSTEQRIMRRAVERAQKAGKAGKSHMKAAIHRRPFSITASHPEGSFPMPLRVSPPAPPKIKLSSSESDSSNEESTPDI
eukprot:1372760-Prymnesium_polylepis.1